MSDPSFQARAVSSRVGRLGAGGMLLLLTYLGFVSLGLPDAAYGVAWPSLETEFVLSPRTFGTGLLTVGLGFLVSSLSAGTLLRRFGAGRLLAASTLLTALGLLGFALAPSWPLFLLAGILAGLGGGAIDSGLNHYAAEHYSARQMNWLHAAFGLGAALGPLLMATAIAGGGWRFGYVAIAALMLGLAALFFATRRRWIEDRAARTESAAPVIPVPVGQALASRLVWLQTATFFVYAGVEIGTGQWAFAVLTQSRAYSVEEAGLATGAFWFALFLGRVLLGFGAERIGSARLVRGGSLVLFVALLVFAFDPLGLGVAGLFLAGFACAPIFPMLIHRTPGMVGPALSAHSIGFQVSAAMMGGVAVPAAGGLLADLFGLETVPVFLAAAAALSLLLAEFGLRAGSAAAARS